MATVRRHHTVKDIDAKLRQADDMAATGSTQKEISQALGISVMTYHRWRRSRSEHPSDESAASPPPAPIATPPGQFSALLLENERLRRLVTDLLLEKMALQEQLEGLRQASRRQEA